MKYSAYLHRIKNYMTAIIYASDYLTNFVRSENFKVLASNQKNDLLIMMYDRLVNPDCLIKFLTTEHNLSRDITFNISQSWRIYRMLSCLRMFRTTVSLYNQMKHKMMVQYVDILSYFCTDEKKTLLYEFVHDLNSNISKMVDKRPAEENNVETFSNNVETFSNNVETFSNKRKTSP